MQWDTYVQNLQDQKQKEPVTLKEAQLGDLLPFALSCAEAPVDLYTRKYIAKHLLNTETETERESGDCFVYILRYFLHTEQYSGIQTLLGQLRSLFKTGDLGTALNCLYQHLSQGHNLEETWKELVTTAPKAVQEVVLPLVTLHYLGHDPIIVAALLESQGLSPVPVLSIVGLLPGQKPPEVTGDLSRFLHLPLPRTDHHQVHDGLTQKLESKN